MSVWLWLNKSHQLEEKIRGQDKDAPAIRIQAPFVPIFLFVSLVFMQLIEFIGVHAWAHLVLTIVSFLRTLILLIKT